MVVSHNTVVQGKPNKKQLLIYTSSRHISARAQLKPETKDISHIKMCKVRYLESKKRMTVVLNGEFSLIEQIIVFVRFGARPDL